MTDGSQQRPPIFALVAGEVSGDILGAGLICALKKRFPMARFLGIGGPLMIAQGFESLYPQDRLAVMGLVEPLKRLPELLSIRRHLIRHFIDIRPVAVIGIDSPDFNLGLEFAVRKAGLRTVHYVSPSVWAWRQGRIKKIAKAVDLMLTLLPFEAQFYRDHRVPVKFVGHPLADQIPFRSDQQKALSQLGLSDKKTGEIIVALLPGSRAMEVQRLARVFLETAQLLYQSHGTMRFLLPSASPQRHTELQKILSEFSNTLPVTLLQGNSLLAMEAADAVLMASGTTTLEALLLKRPMVIAYRVAAISYWIFKRLVKVRFIGLPNLLAERALVPELIQHQATPLALAAGIRQCIQLSESERHALIHSYDEIHDQLKQDASETAATAITQLIAGEEVS